MAGRAVADATKMNGVRRIVESGGWRPRNSLSILWLLVYHDRGFI